MRWARKIVALLIMGLTFVPVALLFGTNSETPPALVYVITGCVQVAFMLLLEGIFPNRHRLIAVPLLVASAVLQYIIFFNGLHTLLFVVPVFAFSLIGVGLARLFNERTMSFQQLCSGAILYGVVFLLSFLFDAVSIQPALGACFAVYLILSVLLLNLTATGDAAGRLTSSSLRWGNLALTALFILLAVLLVNIGAIRDLLGTLMTGIVAAIVWLGNLFGGGGGMENAPSASGNEEMILPEADEGGMPVWLEKLLEIVGTVITVAVLIILLILLLIWIGRNVRKLYLKFLAWLKPDAAKEADYQDEQFSLMSWKQVRVNAREGITRTIKRITYRPPRWDSLNNRQKVRFAMEGMLYRGGKRTPDASLTAREHLAKPVIRDKGDRKSFADAYDRARYSQEEVTEEEAQNARQFL